MTLLGSKAGGARRKLLVGLVVLAAVVLALPYVAAPWVRGVIVERLENDLDAQASLEELSFGLSGRVHLGGLALAANDGRTIATAREVDGRVGLLGVVFGKYDVELALTDFELHLWKDDEGEWNVAGLGKDDATEDDEETSEDEPEPLPSLRAKLAAENGRVVFHGPEATTTLALRLAADLESWSQPAPFELDVEVSGPDGPGGTIRVNGQCSLADRGRRGARGASGALDIEIVKLRAAALEPLLALVAPLQEIGGELNGRVELELSEELALAGDLELDGSDVVLALEGSASPLRVASVSVQGEATSDADGAGAQSLAFEAGGLLSATYRGTLASAEDERRVIDGNLTLEGHLAGLSELARSFVELREGVAVEGQLTGDLQLHCALDRETRPVELDVRALLGANGLGARDGDGSPVPLDALEGATLELDASADMQSSTLALRSLKARAGALELDGQGTLTGVPGLGAADGPLTVSSSSWNVRADLGALRKDLERFLPPGDERLDGRLAARIEAEGGADAPIRTRGEATLENLDVVWPVGEETLRFSEPRIDLSFDAELTTGDTTEVTGKLGLVSEVARGELLGGVGLATEEEVTTYTFRQVEGTFTYVPDRLAALAGPWLPGKLSGAQAERLDFRLDGPATGFTPEELFAATTASAYVGVGTLEMDGLTLEGELAVDVQDGRSRLGGLLQANGGTLKLDGELGLTAAAKTSPRFHFQATDVRANRQLSPLMGRLHPAFAAAEAVKGSTLGGLITTDLELSHSGALSLADLLAGDTDAILGGLDGRGSFQLSSAQLEGSPLMGQLLSELGLDVTKGLELDAIEFVIDKGRVSYAKPWQWTIEETKTAFSGSIGLDKTLSMAWSIPVSEPLIRKHKFLSSLAGEVIEVPLGGTVTRPRLELGGLITSLASKAAQKELQKALGGGGGEDGEDGESAEELFQRANELWSRGEKVEAAALYERIREEYKLSLIYALNRDRIKKRGKYEPE